jgi:hypothetical protein
MANYPQKRKISSFISTQVPQSVSDKYGTYVDFIKAYYAWTEQPNNVTDNIFGLLNNSDIDDASELFLTHFRQQYFTNISAGVLLDTPSFIKQIKQFYTERGSENSFKYLFRILFNEDVELYYPKTDILRVSDGTWISNKIIRTTSNTNTFAWIGHTITGAISGATATVDNIAQIAMNGIIVSEVSLTNLSGTLIPNENIIFNNNQTTDTIFPILTKIVVRPNSKGLKYSVGDSVTIVDTTGKFALATVGATIGTENGLSPLSTINTITLGVNASSVTDYYKNLSISISDGLGWQQVKTITAYNGTTKVATIDSNWDIIPNVFSHYTIQLGQVLRINIYDFGLNYSNSPVITLSTGDGTALADGIVGAVGVYPGYWKDSKGLVNDTPKIQDSLYYQEFSYVIKSRVSLEKYATVIENILHPSGTLMNGEIDLSSHVYNGPDYNELERDKTFYKPDNTRLDNFANLTVTNILTDIKMNVNPDSEITTI